MKLEVFDPPMCCATGICGNSVDPKLVSFASDLEWLKKQGIEVVRYGLSFEPAEFVKNEAVKNTLQSDGNDCLPIVMVSGEIVSKACYPNRAKLAEICNLEYKEDFGDSSQCDCSTAPAEDNCICGPDCDCHKSAVSHNFKKILFIIIILIMLGIVAVKFCCKAGAAENLYKTITSITQINSSEDVAFVYIPSVSGEKISNSTNSAMLSAQKALKAKNISASLYTLTPKSLEYPQISSKTTPPAILTIFKGKNRNYVSGKINTTKLLQAYMAASMPGCGADCPCHKK